MIENIFYEVLSKPNNYCKWWWGAIGTCSRCGTVIKLLRGAEKSGDFMPEAHAHPGRLGYNCPTCDGYIEFRLDENKTARAGSGLPSSP